MKDMLRNKAIIGLCILMLGFTYIKATPKNIMEDEIESHEKFVFENK